MNEIPVAEAKNRFSELVKRVEAGEQIVVTRRGKPVACLVAVDESGDSQRRSRRVADTFLRLERLRQGKIMEGDLQLALREQVPIATKDAAFAEAATA